MNWFIALLWWTGPGCILLLTYIHALHPKTLPLVVADLPRISSAVAVWALVLSVTGIVLFWLGAQLTLHSDRSVVPLDIDTNERGALAIGVAASAAWLAVVLISIALGFGVLGRPVPSLPLPMRIALSRGPSLLAATVLACYAAVRSTKQRTVLLTSALVPIALFVWVTTSRGAVAQFVLPFLLLDYCRSRDRRGRRRMLMLIALLAAVLVLVYPILSQRRGDLTNLAPAGSGQDVGLSLVRVGLRPQGAAGSLYLVADKFPSQPTFQPSTAVNVYTTNVVGVTVANDFRSPGVMAGLYLVGGPLGFAAGLLVLGAGFCAILQTTVIRPLGLAASAYFVVRGFIFLSEGTLQPQDLIVTGAGVGLILLLGSVLSDRKTKDITPPPTALGRRTMSTP